MAEDAYIDCDHNPDPGDIEFNKITGEEIEPVCEYHDDMNVDLVHRKMDSVEFQRFVHKVENALIVSVLATLLEKNVITKTVYENAVNIVAKQ